MRRAGRAMRRGRSSAARAGRSWSGRGPPTAPRPPRLRLRFRPRLRLRSRRPSRRPSPSRHSNLSLRPNRSRNLSPGRHPSRSRHPSPNHHSNLSLSPNRSRNPSPGRAPCPPVLPRRPPHVAPVTPRTCRCRGPRRCPTCRRIPRTHRRVRPPPPRSAAPTAVRRTPRTAPCASVAHCFWTRARRPGSGLPGGAGSSGAGRVRRPPPAPGRGVDCGAAPAWRFRSR